MYRGLGKGPDRGEQGMQRVTDWDAARPHRLPSRGATAGREGGVVAQGGGSQRVGDEPPGSSNGPAHRRGPDRRVARSPAHPRPCPLSCPHARGQDRQDTSPRHQGEGMPPLVVALIDASCSGTLTTFPGTFPPASGTKQQRSGTSGQRSRDVNSPRPGRVDEHSQRTIPGPWPGSAGTFAITSPPWRRRQTPR